MYKKDQIYGPNSTTQELYVNFAKDIINSAMCGMNGIQLKKIKNYIHFFF